jgi:serine protease Do
MLKDINPRRWFAAGAAIAVLGAGLAYESVKPAFANPAPAAAALDDSSVSALLSLDRAMETLAARVTPAIVNVAVTSHAKADMADEQQLPEGMQQFFGPFFGQRMHPQQPQIEHGIGSGVIISPEATSSPIITSLTAQSIFASPCRTAEFCTRSS